MATLINSASGGSFQLDHQYRLGARRFTGPLLYDTSTAKPSVVIVAGE